MPCNLEHIAWSHAKFIFISNFMVFLPSQPFFLPFFPFLFIIPFYILLPFLFSYSTSKVHVTHFNSLLYLSTFRSRSLSKYQMGRVICQIYRLYKQITSGAGKKIRTSHFLEFLNPPKTHHTRMTVNTCNRPNFKILPLFKPGDAGTESLELQQKRRYKSRLNS